MKHRKKGMQDMHDVTKKGGANKLSDESLTNIIGGLEVKNNKYFTEYIMFNEKEASILLSHGVDVKAGVEYSCRDIERKFYSSACKEVALFGWVNVLDAWLKS